MSDVTLHVTRYLAVSRKFAWLGVGLVRLRVRVRAWGWVRVRVWG